MGIRLAKVLVLAVLALGVTASSGTAAAPARAPILGVVPHAGTQPPSLGVPLATTFGSGPVVYHGGEVMPTNTTYAIYWVPSGFFFADPNYESLIDRYFTDVAAASGSQSNVYSVPTQYYGTSTTVQYQSTFGGAYVDTTAFPSPNNCNDGGDAVCLTDLDLQAEIQRVLTLKDWHASTSTMFFVLTPNGVGSCFDGSDNQCTTNVFCAYHSDFIDQSGERVIYANEPYAGTIQGCTGSKAGFGQQGFPNSHDADATINTISHEHNEAISDPFGDAWWANDPNGDEIADLCAGDFGSTPLGMANGQPYDQLINGHPYSIQEEYSNENSNCVRDYTPTLAPSTVAPPALGGAPGQGQVLTTSVGAWLHAPSGYAYQWERCAASGTGCADISGAAAATYTLTAADVGHTVRSSVSAHNGVGTASFVASAPSSVVVPLPSATAAPTLSGLPAVHKKLSTTTGSWNTAAGFAYQWLRCAADGTACTTISGATAATYVAVAADAGHTLEARVSATNAAGMTAALSKRSGVVVVVLAVKKAPHISGRARVGRRLSATHGSWSGPPKSYRYQWLRCNARGVSCARIRHATHAKYRLTKTDARHRLRVRVTAVNAAGSKMATSARTARVPAT